MREDTINEYNYTCWMDNDEGTSSISKLGKLEIQLFKVRDFDWCVSISFNNADDFDRMTTIRKLVSKNMDDAKKESEQVLAGISIDFSSSVDSYLQYTSKKDTPSIIPHGFTMSCMKCGYPNEPKMRDPSNDSLWYGCVCGQRWKSCDSKEKKCKAPSFSFQSFELTEGPMLDPRETGISWKEMFQRMGKIKESFDSRLLAASSRLKKNLLITEVPNIDFFPCYNVHLENGTVIGTLKVNETSHGLWSSIRIENKT